MPKYRVRVDRKLCIGAASCLAVAPNTYDLDDENKAVMKKKDGTQTSDTVDFVDINDTEENIINGAKSCPVDAVIITEIDDQGNEVKQIWPAV